jgi:hypothetical protein
MNVRRRILDVDQRTRSTILALMRAAAGIRAGDDRNQDPPPDKELGGTSRCLFLADTVAKLRHLTDCARFMLAIQPRRIIVTLGESWANQSRAAGASNRFATASARRCPKPFVASGPLCRFEWSFLRWDPRAESANTDHSCMWSGVTELGRYLPDRFQVHDDEKQTFVAHRHLPFG